MGTPRYPRDLSSEWTGLKRSVKDAFTSANKRVGMAKIGAAVVEITGSLILNSGAELRAIFKNGTEAFKIGRWFWQGKNVQGTIMRRGDGSAVFWTWSNENDATDGFWGFYDKSGNMIVSDDGASGVGLARPWIPYTTFKTDEVTGNPYKRNTSSTYQVQHTLHGYAQHPKIIVYMYIAVPSGDVGQFLIRDTETGTAIYESPNYTSSAWVGVIIDVPAYQFGKVIRYDMEARRVSGTGIGVGITPTLVWGRQS